MDARPDVRSLYGSEWHALVRLVTVVSGDADAAPDIVQDVFVELTEQFDQLRNPAGWLRTAAVHRAVSWARRRGTARRYLQRHCRESEPIDDVAAAVARRDVRQALSRLSPEQRAVVFLRYYLDLPESAIAEAMGCRLGTVKSRLFRAQQQLKGDLDVT